MIRVVIICFFLITYFHANLFAGQYHFNTIGFEDGFTQDLTLDVYQDELSRIWTATSDGINCYEGNTVYTYRINDIENKGVRNFNVWRITGDKNGHLYLRTSLQILIFDLKTQSVKILWNAPSNTMAVGRDGLWFVANQKLYQYDFETKKIYPRFTNLNYDFTSRKMLESKNGTLWIAGDKKGLTKIAPDGFFLEVPIEDEILSLYEDINKNIWIGTKQSGIYCYSPIQSQVIRHIKPDFNEIRALSFDREQNLWFGSRKGLGKYQFNTKDFFYFSPDDKTLNPVTYNSVNTLFTDKFETLWIGTYLGGVNYLNLQQQNFQYLSSKNTNLPLAAINILTKDDFGNIWIGTEGGGISKINEATNHIKNYSKATAESIGTDNVKDVFWDKNKEVLWIVGNFSNILTSISPVTNEVRNFPIHYPSMEENDVNALYGVVANGNNIYLVKESEILIYNLNTGKTVKSEELSSFYNRLSHHLMIDRLDNMWFIGVDKVISYSLLSGKKREYKIDTGGRLLGPGNVFYNDLDGNIWLGTNGLGLFVLDSKAGFFKSFNEFRPLQNSNILSISETNSGDMFFATENGMILWNKSNNAYKFFAYNKNFIHSKIKRRSVAITKSGNFYLGATNGVFVYSERNFINYKQAENIFLSRLFINNKQVKVSEKNSFLKEALPYTKKLILPHTQSHITIEYYVDNFISGLNLIEYRLKSYSNEWIENRNQNTISFSNLSPGNYTFQVRLINKPEVLSELKIRVKPPILASWWALIFYSIIVGLTIWWIIKLFRESVFFKTSLEFEKQEKENIEEMNQSKLQFFTNIAHEIRTPITLILAQIDLLLESHKLDDSMIKKLRNIYRSTSSLKTLVNELLDFRKQEKGALKLNVVKVNVVPLFNEYLTMFYELASAKNIQLQYDYLSSEIDLWIDTEQMHKVVNNLLLNAIKYSVEKGNIVLKLREDNKTVFISVEDSGPGIDESEREKIFERFYQIKNTHIIGGSGIGMAITKNIVELHGGKIHVTNANPIGSIFTVEIPKGNEHLNSDVVNKLIISNLIDENENIGDKNNLDNIINQSQIETMNILVVDDNPDIRDTLTEILGKYYHVSLSVDGVEAYNKVSSELPDMVVSDIMMPNMTGTELCRKIKDNIETCHIPVILLTAKSGIENEIEGLKVGADSYISKPFTSEHLLVQINTLFESRRKLRQKFFKDINAPVEDITENSYDQNFLRKATRIIEENLENQDFNIDVLSREMAMGRTTLFSKMKGVTGQTPNNFILNIRLKKAAQLLINHEGLNITDITYKLMFSSPRYFNKCFKELFGVAPAIYRKNNRRK